ncbi:unnamed protein product [Rangifer tarandus platyrhynchus]|uniref:Uncharacterized protein n=1 Tax=Rangifer tarandus platyrhynchus TaxID=3082113 RepID=A0AC59Z1Z0_RANTA
MPDQARNWDMGFYPAAQGQGGLTLDWVPLGTLTAKYAWTSRSLGRRGQTEEGTTSNVGKETRLPAEAASVLWLVPLRTDIAARGTEAGQPLKGAEEMMPLLKLKESRARGSDKG